MPYSKYNSPIENEFGSLARIIYEAIHPRSSQWEFTSYCIREKWCLITQRIVLRLGETELPPQAIAEIVGLGHSLGTLMEESDV